MCGGRILSPGVGSSITEKAAETDRGICRKIHHENSKIPKALGKGKIWTKNTQKREDFARNTFFHTQDLAPSLSFLSAVFCNDHSQNVSHRHAAIVVQVSWQGSPYWKKTSHRSLEVCVIKFN